MTTNTLTNHLLRVFHLVKQNRLLNAALLQPFYLLRFVYASIREKSGQFSRYYPGYHGSTIPSLRHILEERTRFFDTGIGLHVDGIRLREEEQRALLVEFTKFWPDFSPPATQQPDCLYFYDNPMYGFNDAFILYSFLRHFKPGRVIEVGSGHSSALMLDVAHKYLPTTQFTFIDPYSTTIGDVLARSPRGSYQLVREELQNIPITSFTSLGEGDILFIDTSHVVKIGSDLSSLFFSVLPALNKGVIIHIHDIWYPWEYPETMLREGRAYNEIYFLRAFLQFNETFEIIYFNSLVEARYRGDIEENMPGFFKDTGKSLWLRKVL